MNSHQNTNYSNDDDIDNEFNRESMLGCIPNPDSTTSEVNQELDQEVNEWLKEIVDEELGPDNIGDELKDGDCANDSLDPRKEQYQDYYDDFPEQDQEPIPQWYEEMLQKKISDTKKCLKKLSDYACYASATTKQQISRIERDHNSYFCKLDFPRHPPLSQPWQNYWRFNCVRKCKEDPNPPPYHAHTADCELLLLEHVGTGVTTRSKNILPCEFPKYVMDTVEMFQIFAKESSKVNLNNDEVPDTVFEKPTWQYIKIRSNYKGEILLVACGKGITPALSALKTFFYSGRGIACNVVSLYCINIKWSQKKGVFPPTFLTGCLELRDKVGPLTIYYNPKTNINFNSAEAVQLGKIMLEYLEPTLETTVIDIGCNIGTLSLMLAQKSDKVVGLSTLDYEIKSAEQLKKHNNLHNVSFMTCSAREINTKISTHVRKCISVAVVNLNSPFGKVKDCSEVMLGLRELPTIWRIALYGSFPFINHKCIEKLTTAANGSEFLPMRGCLIDKSPSKQNLFDIVILFERKSLIEPKIELIASGPTVNLKSDSFASETNIANIPIKQEFNARFPGSKPFLKGGRPSKKFGRFDSPMLPIEKDVKPKLPPPPKEILDFTAPPPPLPPSAKPPSYTSIEKDLYSSKEKSHRPSVIDMLNVKELKRKFDSPSLPINPPKTTNVNLRNQEININGFEQSINSDNSNSSQTYDSPTLSKTSALDYPSWHKPAEIQPTNSGFLRVKQEFELQSPSQFESLSKPVHPVLEAPNRQNFQNCFVKNEKEFACSSISIKKEESGIGNSTKQKSLFAKMPSPVEREEGELSDSGDNSICLDAIIKPEPMDLDDGDSESDFSLLANSQVKDEVTENKIVQSLRCVKNESIDFNEFSIQPIKSEPSEVNEDLESINSTDSNNLPIKLDSESTNLKEMHVSREVENQFSWHSNFTGLHVKPEPSSVSLSVNVKSEPTDDDVQTLEEVSENTSSAGVTVKSEILSSLPDIDDIENMETPIHNPVALTRQLTPSPPPSTSTYDGFEFSVKPNMSFLPLNKEVEKQSVKVKEETVKPESDEGVKNQDDEIKIIDIKGEFRDKARTNIKLEHRISVKSETSSSETAVGDKQNDDLLRILLEQRQKLQKQLESNIDCENSKRKFRRSPLRRERSPYSPNQWRSKSRYSPDSFRRRDRSPEFSKWSRSYRSPSFDRYRGKRYRSPTSPNRKSYRNNQSPDSPDRFYRRRYHSNSLDSPVSKRRNQSPDIYEKLYGRKIRSSESPEKQRNKKNRSSESPEKQRNKRNRSSESPVRPRYRSNRSSISPDKPWLKRNETPPSFERNWRYRNKSPPEIGKNWDSKYKVRSPSRRNSRSKSRSTSPSTRRRRRSSSSSLSPPFKYFKSNKTSEAERKTKSPSPALSDKRVSDSKKKKKKKKKKSSKSSPHRSESEKREKKKSSKRKSIEKLNLQLEVVSPDDSPSFLEKPTTEELLNKSPTPTTVA